MTKHAGNKAPRIRFKGFSEGWRERPIGEVLSEKRRPIVLMDDQRYELITVKRRNEGVVSRGHLRGREILVKNYSQLETGDFVISKRQVVHGATGIIPPELNKAIVSNEYLVAVSNDDISTEFLTLLSSLPDMQRKFFLSSYGVDIEKLFFDAADWKKRSIAIPTASEQTKIDEYFRELDRLFRLHQRKHDKLVTLKKAMLQKMFPQPGATNPEIRFKGFSGAWAKKRLGESTTTVANNTLSRANLKYGSGLAKNVHYGDILVRFGEVLDAQSAAIPHISDDAVATKLKSANLIDGDIVMADAAEDETVGKCTEIQNVADQIVLAGLHTIALRPLLRFAPFYLGYYLNSHAFHGQLLRIMQGTKVLSISKTAIKQTIIRFPHDEVEQQKIGAYFRTLDELISKHALQLQKLRQLKSACLERMFV